MVHSAKTGSVKTGSIRESHTRDPHTREIRLSFESGTTPREPHTREPRRSFTPGASFIPRTHHVPRSTPAVKVDSLAPEIRNKVPWKETPWVLAEESEVSKSELVNPMPSGKVGSNPPGDKSTTESNARL